MDELMRVGDVAKRLRVSSETVRRWMDSGHLKHVRWPSGQRRAKHSDVEALAADLGIEPQP